MSSYKKSKFNQKQSEIDLIDFGLKIIPISRYVYENDTKNGIKLPFIYKETIYSYKHTNFPHVSFSNNIKK